MKACFMRLLLAVPLLFCITTASAAPGDGVQTINPYDEVGDSDLSANLVRSIFGEMALDVLDPAGNPNTGDNTPTTIVAAMSLTLNAACLFLACFLIIFGGLTGAMQTAHEGVVMGKRYSTLWWPIRMAVGVSFLVPVLGGYSFVQGAVLLSAKAGIGVANYAYRQGIDYIAGGGLLATPNFSYAGSLAHELLRSEICARVLSQSIAGASDRVVAREFSYDPTSNAFNVVRTSAVSGVSYDGANGAYATGICGKYTLSTDLSSDMDDKGIVDSGNWMGLPVPKDILDLGVSDNEALVARAKGAHDMHWNAFNALRARISGIADTVVQNSLNGHATPADGALDEAVADYKEQLLNYTRQQMASASSVSDQSRRTLIENLKTSGWITAGAYYWQLQAINTRMYEIYGKQPQYQSVNVDALDKSVGVHMTEDLKAFLESGEAYIKESNDVKAAIAESRWGGGFMQKLFGGEDGSMVTGIIAKMTSKGDPIIEGMSIGHDLIALTYIGAGAAAALGMVSSVGKNVGKIPGAGMFGGILGDVAGMAAVILGVLLLAMFMLGMFLAFYLPAIPFTLWILGAGGWFILLVEAVVAAPIWAAAHTMPEGDGWAGTHARAGYLLILSLIMRPLLMLIGFVAGMLVLYVTSLLVGAIFPVAMKGIMGDHMVGPASFIGLMAVFAGIMIALAHQSFALSHVIPDKILRWIGGGQEMLGEARDVSHATAATGQTMATVQSTATKAAAAGAVASQLRRRRAEEAATAKAGADAAGSQKDAPSQAEQALHAPTDTKAKPEDKP